MSQITWDEIASESDRGHSLHGIVRDHARVQTTAEIFTPTALVVALIEQLGADRLAPGKKILDPACGDGQFLAASKVVKMKVHEMSEEDALADIFGIDIMADNVKSCRRRLGGGTIVVGDALNPDRVVEGQSEEDRLLLARIIGASNNAEQSSLFG